VDDIKALCHGHLGGGVVSLALHAGQPGNAIALGFQLGEQHLLMAETISKELQIQSFWLGFAPLKPATCFQLLPPGTDHRAAGEKADSFICYQKLEANIASVQEHGVDGFEVLQKKRENLLKEFLQDFNEGRSKSNFCIAATVLEIKELEGALQEARQKSEGLDRKEKSRLMHTLLDEIAAKKGYLLKLRKGDGKCPQKT